MNEYLARYLLFLAECLSLAVALGLALGLTVAAARGGREPAGEGRLRLRHVNDRLRRTGLALNGALLDRRSLRLERRRLRREAKQSRPAATRPRTFVLDFRGDIGASQVSSLREEVSALCQVLKPDDEVLLRLESGGGTVHGYGLAASQLRRLRDRGTRLTVAVDKVAASGGYMMAAVAEHIVAAPFAIVGSIGVVAQIPNFNRLLKRKDVDMELHTAGRYKRTLTVFGENTDEGRAKFREELEDAHALFREFLAEQRPALDLERVATGEHWYGARALALGLVDELRTSDDWLLQRTHDREVYELQYKPRRALGERIGDSLGRAARLLRAPLSGMAGRML